jgi:hypothetical protein
MEDNFIANSLVIYIERKIAESFNLDSILNNFVLLRDRNVHFYILFFLIFNLCLFDIVPTCYISNISI